MNDDYDWAEDAIASYAVAIDSLRERYLKKRLPGESAKKWLERASVTENHGPYTDHSKKKGLRGDF